MGAPTQKAIVLSFGAYIIANRVKSINDKKSNYRDIWKDVDSENLIKACFFKVTRQSRGDTSFKFAHDTSDRCKKLEKAFYEEPQNGIEDPTNDAIIAVVCAVGLGILTSVGYWRFFCK